MVRLEKHVANRRINAAISVSDHDFTLKVTAEGSEAGVGKFLTTANFVCHGHVTRDTFENVAPRGRKTLPAKRRDKARLKRLAVCCSSYHESARSEDTVPREPELEEPPPGGVGLARARFPQLLLTSNLDRVDSNSTDG